MKLNWKNDEKNFAVIKDVTACYLAELELASSDPPESLQVCCYYALGELPLIMSLDLSAGQYSTEMRL